MPKFVIEVDSCCNCPCLRNNPYETYSFSCFYNDSLSIDNYDVNEIYEQCPLKKFEIEED